MQTLTLHAILSPSVFTVATDTPMTDVLASMELLRISCVVATDDKNTPLGIFTEQDAVRLMAERRAVAELCMADVMSSPPLTASSDLDFRDAYQLLSEQQFRHLVVVDQHGKLAGIVSEADFMHHMGMEYLVELKTVGSAMTRDPVTLKADATLADAVDLMAKHRISCIVITSEQKPIGILTERDSISLARTVDNPSQVQIVRVMKGPVQTIEANLPVQAAMKEMDQSGIRRLVVVEGEIVAGIITRHDIVKNIQGSYLEFLHETLQRQRNELYETRRIIESTRQQMLYHSLMEQVSDAILVSHAESGAIVDCNAQACISLDYTRDALLNLTLFDIVPDLERGGIWKDRVQLMKDAGQRLIKTFHIRRDGSRFPVEVNANLIERDQHHYIVAVARDISAQKAAHDTLLAQRSMLQQIIDTAPASICWKDRHSVYLGCNKSFARQAGLDDPAQIVGKTDYELPWTRIEANAYRADDHDVMAHDRPKHHVIEMRQQADGSNIWLNASRVPLKNPDGVIFGVLSIYQDITELKENQVKLEFMAHHDSLTNLPNRTLAERRLEQELEHARRHHHALCVLFIDLDRFKPVNDSYGHLIGDELLCQVAERLKYRLREGDTLGRLGGDEFILIASPLQDKQDAAVIARDFIRALNQPFSLSNGAEVFIGGSVGISLFPENGDTIEELTKNADAAMYLAKESGRNQFSFYSPELNADARGKLELENDLRRAVLNNELSLHFQSKIDMETGAICGAEALSRWQLPDGRWIPPASFIPLAEKSGVILTIGNWVIEQACKQIRQWLDAGLPEICIAVNISARQFRSAHFSNLVKAALTKYEVPAHLLELELTESMLMNEPERAIETMHRLKELGVKLSLDDFGTGYSNFSYLRRFPIDRLKIDQSFVSGMTTRSEDAMIVDTIIDLAHRMSLRVTGEGVETSEQMDYLRGKHCNELQGFLFSEALPPASFAHMLRNGTPLH